MLEQLPLSPKQVRSIAQATSRINIWSGAIRSGKTIASLIAFLLAVVNAPSTGLIVVVGRSLQTIERNVLDPLQTIELFGPVARQVHHTRGATTAVILGRTVHLIGASDARAEGRLRGLTACLAYVDEATLMPEGFWNQLLGRLSVPGARLLATTNPDGPAHWLRRRFIQRAGELDLRSWHFTLDDNPSLAPEYVASLKAEYVGLWYKRFIDGAWVQAEGAVYDMFDPGRHVIDVLPQIARWTCVGVDYGTVNPLSALLIGHGTDGRLYAASEYRHDSRAARQQLTDAQYSARMRDWLARLDAHPEWVFVDPSAASFSTQLWQDGLTGVTPAVNDVLDGIRSVSVALGSGLLSIHRSCTGLIEELPGYAWDDAAAERGEDKPLKLNDHSCDALRYALHSTAHDWRGLIRPEEAHGAAA
ncbi:PBSX family phage terminase large subunit [Kitasatospora sp. NPDC056181]|uniref:PBSX family phage terminase large subunit n=1 Tax=Kitasatospora sp. NPDC056181 TaxID=3345737 RepID=UPI0035DD16D4